MSQDDEYAATSERMEVTRYHSSAGDYLIYLFHVVTYEFAAQRLGGARVLDYGCGTGYGSHHLSTAAASVVGVDVSEDAVRYARRRYDAPGLEFLAVQPVEREPLPFEDGSFDAVVSFQVIEHVPSTDAYLAEVARLLRPGGTFLCATPDRTTRLLRGQRPWNRWHLEEFTPQDLAGRIGRHLQVEEVLGMTATPGVVDLELRRCRLLRAASLPFTFPGAPERWRVGGLEAMRVASTLPGRVRRLRGRGQPDASASEVAAPEQGAPEPGSRFGFGPQDVVIAAGAAPSTNTVVVATKPGGTPAP